MEFIRQLLREKDEARQNYSQETIRSQRLAAELEAAQSDRAVVWAQLTVADSRVACRLFFLCIVPSFFKSLSLTLRSVSSGVTGPDPPCRSSHRYWFREVAGRGVRRGAVVALATAQFQSDHDFL